MHPKTHDDDNPTLLYSPEILGSQHEKVLDIIKNPAKIKQLCSEVLRYTLSDSEHILQQFPITSLYDTMSPCSYRKLQQCQPRIH